MSKTDLFSEAFKHYGLPWHISAKTPIENQVIRQLRDFFDWAVKSQKRAVGPRGLIYCDLIDNPTFNAVATVHHDYEFVTLFSGAINQIYVVYFAFLSDPESLALVGNASGESVDPAALWAIRQQVGVIVPRHLPRDPQRLQAARDLSALTCLFILLHEVGHIVWGHSIFLDKRYGMAAYEELPVSMQSKEQMMVELALEWEADEYAAITSYQTVHKLLEDASRFPALRDLSSDLIWSLSVSMAFVLIGYLYGGVTLDTPTHPSPNFRYVWSMLSVEGAPECKQFSPQTAELQQGFAEVARWFVRNGLELGHSGQELASLDTAVEIQRFYDQYRDAKQRLVKEAAVLGDIQEQRRTGADEWLRVNRI